MSGGTAVQGKFAQSGLINGCRVCNNTLRPSPGFLSATPESKSLLVLFFRKEQESSFSEEKEAKRLLCLALRPMRDRRSSAGRRPKAL
jgi:hypothetical protein